LERVKSLECGDLSPLSLRGGSTPRFFTSLKNNRSRQVATCESGDRSPHSKGVDAVSTRDIVRLLALAVITFVPLHSIRF